MTPHPSKRSIEHTDLSHSSEFFVALPPKSLPNPSTLTPPPTTLTGNETETESLCAFDLHKSKCPPPKSLSNPSTLSPPPTTLTGNESETESLCAFDLHKSKCPPPKSLSNPSTLTPPPTTLTGNESETESLCDFDLHKSKCQPPKSLSNPSTLTPPPTPLTWQELNSDLQAVFPTNDTYTYIVENYQSKEPETFPGAPGIAFDIQVRINLNKTPFLSQRFACKTDTSVGH